MPSTVLVVDDFAEYREYLCKLLNQNSDFVVVGEAPDGMAAMQRAAETQPDIILLDIGLPSLGGLDAIGLIQKVSPRSRVVFITQQAAPEVIRAAFERGASAYLSKFYVADELRCALRCVMEDVLFLGKYSLGDELGPVQ